MHFAILPYHLLLYTYIYNETIIILVLACQT